ncbi:BCCT family transporter [Curvivirga sp.]|uniref:BCCT family transporter n=1 Tax=Curvivirga sp. TaxID=2856848 RepID=UPI003B59C168
MKPPLMDLQIKVTEKGFYKGFTKNVTISAKLIVGIIIIWAVAFPESAASFLGGVNSFILSTFNYWYVYAMAFYVLTCLALAVWPASGRLKLGLEDDKPEFSNFSWFSMMFGAGIGIGMLTFATAEPIYHFKSNPSTIMGLTEGETLGNVRDAYIWSFTHWGVAAWASYAVVGLSLAYFSYRRGLPLTVRSGLTPLFGKSLSGTVGHIIDVVAVVATILGMAQTLGFGVDQFVSGLSRIGFGDWLYTVDAEGTRSVSTAAIIVSLIVIMGASTLSALSGVGKGIKWLSNLNMGLSFFLLTFFLIFGSTFFGLQALFVGIYDYIINLPWILFNVWTSDGVEGSVATQLASWQGGWNIFYWAWWIAFAPFVGLFLARVSRGRTVREYVIGAMFIPGLMCFVWFAMVGGTAIDLELNGDANRAILDAGQADQLFAMLNVMLSENLAWVMSLVVMVLLLTYLVTTADSGVLIINTINAAGDEGPKARPHILFWGIAMALVVGGLIIAGGLSAIQTAMVIGALPFSVVMVLMGISVLKAIYKDSKRQAAGIQSTANKEEIAK